MALPLSKKLMHQIRCCLSERFHVCNDTFILKCQGHACKNCIFNVSDDDNDNIESKPNQVERQKLFIKCHHCNCEHTLDEIQNTSIYIQNSINIIIEKESEAILDFVKDNFLTYIYTYKGMHKHSLKN